MKKNRKTGLKYVHEVKEILKNMGFMVEGPGYKVIWLPGKTPIQTHIDYFGLWDLISWSKDRGYEFHQITTYSHWTDRKKTINTAGMNGYIWGRTIVNGKIVYNRYYINETGVDGPEIFQYRNYGGKNENRSMSRIDEIDCAQ